MQLWEIIPRIEIACEFNLKIRTNASFQRVVITGSPRQPKPVNVTGRPTEVMLATESLLY